MLLDDFDRDLFHVHSKEIIHDNVRDAYVYMVGIGSIISDFNVKPNKERNPKNKYVLHFYQGEKLVYDIIINKKSLLFYVRYPNDEPFNDEMRQQIEAAFEVKQDKNSKAEFRFRLENLDQAKQASRILFTA